MQGIGTIDSDLMRSDDAVLASVVLIDHSIINNDINLRHCYGINIITNKENEGYVHCWGFNWVDSNICINNMEN